VIAASVGSLPLVVRSIRLGVESVEPTLLAAARTLGARPLRVIVTGETQTPSIDATLELIGREETITRIDRELARAQA
jgi:glutamyl/glutaminyl-tRNA synthetase